MPAASPTAPPPLHLPTPLPCHGDSTLTHLPPAPAFGDFFAMTPQAMGLYPTRLGQDPGEGFASGSCWRSHWFHSRQLVRCDGSCPDVTDSFFHLANKMWVMMMSRCSSPSCQPGEDDSSFPPACAVRLWEAGSRSGRGRWRGPRAPSPLPRSLHRALVFITFSLVFEKGITCTVRSVPLERRERSEI